MLTTSNGSSIINWCPSASETNEAIERFAYKHNLTNKVEQYLSTTWSASYTGPVVAMDDYSCVPFADGIKGVEHYQYRARVRADNRDIVIAAIAPPQAYERYCSDLLGLGNTTCMVLEGTTNLLALAKECLAQGNVFDQIAHIAHTNGSLLIHPYMSIEPVWELAQALSKETGAHIEVIGPPPPICWIANDKVRFCELVTALLGPEWVPASFVEKLPHKMAQRLQELARRSSRVAIKRSRCASGLGNLVLSSLEVTASNFVSLVTRVNAFLEKTEWDGFEEVLIVEWMEVTSSPSTQLWIPPLSQPPRVEAICDQILVGEDQAFVGSRPSQLPHAVKVELKESALIIARALQQFGYVGQCSFDHLLIGDPHGQFRTLFAECNGRWGGASTPLNLLRRVVDGPIPSYKAGSISHPGLIGAEFEQIIECLGDDLYNPQLGRGIYVLYNVGLLAKYGKLEVIAQGPGQQQAEEFFEERFLNRLGLK